MKCWGHDFGGALGDGGSTNTDLSAPAETPINLGSGRTAVAVSVGNDFVCAILDNGDLKCWGSGGPQLGYFTNNDINAPRDEPLDLGDNRTAAAVCTGDNLACAILDNGDVKCWGSGGQYGALAGNTDIHSPPDTPIDLGDGRTAIDISCGAIHTCVLLDDNSVKCWGWDNHGQLGDGGTPSGSSSAEGAGKKDVRNTRACKSYRVRIRARDIQVRSA